MRDGRREKRHGWTRQEAPGEEVFRNSVLCSLTGSLAHTLCRPLWLFLSFCLTSSASFRTTGSFCVVDFYTVSHLSLFFLAQLTCLSLSLASVCVCLCDLLPGCLFVLSTCPLSSGHVLVLFLFLISSTHSQSVLISIPPLYSFSLLLSFLVDSLILLFYLYRFLPSPLFVNLLILYRFSFSDHHCQSLKSRSLCFSFLSGHWFVCYLSLALVFVLTFICWFFGCITRQFLNFSAHSPWLVCFLSSQYNLSSLCKVHFFSSDLYLSSTWNPLFRSPNLSLEMFIYRSVSFAGISCASS